MKRFLIILSLISVGFGAYAQNKPQPGDPEFLDHYANYDFQHKFSAYIQNDGRSNYFIVDFSQLESRFEKIYFLNRSFSVSEIVNMGFESQKKIVCFKSFIYFPVKDITVKFETLYKETKTAAQTMTQQEKEAWLLKNDKYK